MGGGKYPNDFYLDENSVVSDPSVDSRGRYIGSDDVYQVIPDSKTAEGLSVAYGGFSGANVHVNAQGYYAP